MRQGRIRRLQIVRSSGTYQVDHVRGEEGSAVLLEELLVLVKHAIEPGEELLGAVVGVDYRTP
jgi:hypothetical protein